MKLKHKRFRVHKRLSFVKKKQITLHALRSHTLPDLNRHISRPDLNSVVLESKIGVEVVVDEDLVGIAF